jgi:hypothetical protein
MLYIASCAKSGTHYTTAFLNRLGVQVQHEYPGLDGIVTWYVFHTPNQFPNQLNIDVDNSICLHQTREPLATISSLMHLDDNSWRYIRRAMGMDLTRPLLPRAMEYYYHWHKSLEDCTFQYQVEEIGELIDILDLFKINYDRAKLDWALETVRLGSTPNKSGLRWKDLLYANPDLYLEIRQMGERYGYY